MKLILHELQAAIRNIDADDLQPAFKQMARVSKILSQIINGWDVLATMTPAEYMEFRDDHGNASGFQSYQYRMMEFASGYKTKRVVKIYEKDPVLLEELTAAFEAPGLYDAAQKIEDRLQQWRFRHMKKVERIIGFRQGTGGSSDVHYLKKSIGSIFSRNYGI